MYCRFCLYNLSRTNEPRCPECGCAFDPERLKATTLPSSRRLPWLIDHCDRVVTEGWWSGRRCGNVFCRTCFYDLKHETSSRCPTCGTRFSHHDSTTFRRGDHLFVRLHERFRHVCAWRGLLLTVIALGIGLHAVFTQSTLMLARPLQIYWLRDVPAVSVGVAWIGLATALHMHYFWGQVEPTWRYSALGVVVGLTALLGGIAFALYSAIAGAL